MSTHPFAASQPYAQSPAAPMPATIFNPYAAQPVQQILQLLLQVPQQLQQLLQLEYLQQHQLQQLQQVLQFIPAQLAQLQQLTQFVPQQMQQVQQPFGQIGGAAGASALTPWGLSSQIFGAQPTYVM
jgi:hypothetical protein